jgi:hypothetical protein
MPAEAEHGQDDQGFGSAKPVGAAGAELVCV